MTSPQQIPPFDPARRAIIDVNPADVLDGLGVEARFLDARMDHMRGVLRVLVARDDLEPVELGCEPRRVDVDDLLAVPPVADTWAPSDPAAGREEAIAEALGSVSVAWATTPRGIFDSTRAQSIHAALIRHLDGLAEQPVSAAFGGHESAETLVADVMATALPSKTDGEVLAELGTDGIRWARGLAERLLADYAVSDRTPSGAGLDPAVSDVLDPAGGGTLHVWMANAIEAGRSAGYAAGLAAAGIASGSPTPVPLLDADPQFIVTTSIDGNVIGREAITDPIVRHTIVIDRRDLTPGDQPIRVEVNIGATRAGLRHVMRPIDLTPNDEQPSPPSGHDLMAIGEDAGPAAPVVDTSRPDDHGVIG